MAGIFGLRGEDMEQVDALQRARVTDFPDGLPMVRPHVRALVLVQEEGKLGAKPARFGFSRKFPSMNARSDRLEQSSFWKGMFGKSHALVPLSYVIEWRTRGDVKQPYLIGRRGGGLLYATALLGHYHEDADQLAFAIVTREPNRFFAQFHDRMVGLCPPDRLDAWLNPSGRSKEELLGLVASPADEEMEAVPSEPTITARKAGDWSALPAAGPPILWPEGPPF